MKELMRIGFGYDVHQFAPNRKLWLGGIEVPYERGLLGHSDADVVIHALCDALLEQLHCGTSVIISRTRKATNTKV